MKNLILIITFSVSSMIYAQENTADTITIYDTLFYNDGSVEYYVKAKAIGDTSQNYTGDIYYYNPSNQLEFINHFNQGELLGKTIYEPLKSKDHE